MNRIVALMLVLRLVACLHYSGRASEPNADQAKAVAEIEKSVAWSPLMKGVWTGQ